MPTISLAVILGKSDKKHANALLESLKDKVDEIVIVRTHKDSPKFSKPVKQYNLISTEESFRFDKARQFSFDKCTSDYVLWMDDDDIWQGETTPKQIAKRLEDNGVDYATIVYQYSSNIKFYTNRIVKKGSGEWKLPVHEAFFQTNSNSFITIPEENALVFHCREKYGKQDDIKRNLNVFNNTYGSIKNYFITEGFRQEEDITDRVLFYWANELERNGEDVKQIREILFKKALKKKHLGNQDFQNILDACHIPELFDEDTQKNLLEKLDLKQSIFLGRKLYSFQYNKNISKKSISFLEKCLKYSNQENMNFSPDLLFSIEEKANQFLDNALMLSYEYYRNGYFLSSYLTSLLISEKNKTCEMSNSNVNYYASEEGQRLINLEKIIFNKRKNLFIYAAKSVESWCFDTLDKKAIGGSETAVIKMSKELAKRYNVFVFANIPQEKRFVVNDGVVWLKLEDAQEPWTPTPDIFVSSREVTPPEKFMAEGILKCLWMHDACYNNTLEEMEGFDKIFVLSHWHKNHVLSNYPTINYDKLHITSNGVDFSSENFFDDYSYTQKKYHKAIWSSSPDRGLDEALECWKLIVEEFPDDILEIYYGFDNMELSGGEFAELAKKLKIKIENTKNVKYFGGVRQNELHLAMLNSDCLFYPSRFYETSCITAMEARCANMSIVTSPIGALQPIDLLKTNHKKIYYCDIFNTTTVVDAYKKARSHWNVQQYYPKSTNDTQKKQLTWRLVADSWSKIFEQAALDK